MSLLHEVIREIVHFVHDFIDCKILTSVESTGLLWYMEFEKNTHTEFLASWKTLLFFFDMVINEVIQLGYLWISLMQDFNVTWISIIKILWDCKLNILNLWLGLVENLRRLTYPRTQMRTPNILDMVDAVHTQHAPHTTVPNLPIKYVIFKGSNRIW